MPGRTAWTFFGWTPSLRRLVTGRILGCGCLAGVYETRRGDLVTLIDAVGPACGTTDHVADRILAHEDTGGRQESSHDDEAAGAHRAEFAAERSP